nr:ribonuclease H-like domain-containing protein [Tanacetum cinerariifolium]
MTGNKSFLTEYQEIDGGFVAFGGSSKGGKITVASTSIARPKFNTAAFIPNVNAKFSYFKSHFPWRRHFNQRSAAKTNTFSRKINTAKGKNVTIVGPKAIVNDAKGKKENVDKSSACWIWRPKGNLIDRTSKDSGSYILKRFNYVDPNGRLNLDRRNDSGRLYNHGLLRLSRVKKLERKKKSRTSGLKRLWKIGSTTKVESSKDKESLGNQVDASKPERMIDNIDQNEEITLVDETQGRMNAEEMFGVNNLDGDEVIVDATAGKEVEQSTKVAEKEVSTADSVTIAGKVVLLIRLLLLAKDKGKGIMVEPEKPLKKKDQMAFHEEVARKLEAQMKAEMEEEERIAREKDEANIAVIKQWDELQAKTDADMELPQKLQTKEQEQLTDAKKARLFMELLEKRRKFFARNREIEKRNRPPTKAQQRNLMVNTFVDMNTEIVEEMSKKTQAEVTEGNKTRAERSSKREGKELESNKSKKQKLNEQAEAKVDNDQREAEMKNIRALVDKKKVIITETSVRGDLNLEDAEEDGVKFLMFPRFVQVFLDSQVEGMLKHKDIYVTPSHTKKIFSNMKRHGKDFSGKVTPLFETMMVQPQEDMGEDSKIPTDSHHTPTVSQPSTSSQPQQKHKSKKSKKRITEFPQLSDSTHDMADEHVTTTSNDPLLSGEDGLKLTELMKLCTQLQSRVLALETTKANQVLEIRSLKRRVKKLEKKANKKSHKLIRLYKIGSSTRVESFEDASLDDQEDASKQGRMIADLDADEGVALVDETQGRNDQDMFDTIILDDEEVVAEEVDDEEVVAKEVVAEKEVSTADPVFTAGEVVTTAGFEEDYIMIDEKVTRNLEAQMQAELEEEERLFPLPTLGTICPPRADLSFAGLDNSVLKSKVSETFTSVPKIETNASKTNSEDENVFKPKEVKKTVKPSLEKIEFVNARNTIVENENKADKARKFSQSPRAVVLTKSGQVPVNAAKQSSLRATTSVSAARHVNNVTSRPNVNNALPTPYSYFKAHSPVRRPFNQKSATKTNNFNEKVNTVKVNNVTIAGPKAVVSAAEGNRNNAVKSSACWIWRPKGNLIEHISKDSGSYTLKRFNYVDPQGRLKSDQRIFDSGCSRHMTGNKSYLIDYQEIDGEFVAFGGNAKRGKITKGGKITRKGKIKTGKLDFEDVYFLKELKFNLFSVSQMCDKKNNVLFNDTECVVLSSDFKLLDESQVLLKVPRNNNMYSFDLKNVVPVGGLTIIFAKATLDEANLWHRRLGHKL